jgi:hypothetical protein
MFGRAAALALLLAAAQPAMAEIRSEAMLRDLIDAIDSAEDWSASADAIRSAGADTFAEGVSITRDEPRLSFRIGAVRVRDLNPTGNDGAFSASEIEATGFEAAGDDDDRFTIPTATARDVTMPSFAGLTIDERRLMSSVARFYTTAAEGEVGEIVIPEATASARDVPRARRSPSIRVWFTQISAWTGSATAHRTAERRADRHQYGRPARLERGYHRNVVCRAGGPRRDGAHPGRGSIRGRPWRREWANSSPPSAIPASRARARKRIVSGWASSGSRRSRGDSRKSRSRGTLTGCSIRPCRKTRKATSPWKPYATCIRHSGSAR